MSSWATDDEVIAKYKGVVADKNAEFPDNHPNIVSVRNLDAKREIISVLMKRGFSEAQIEAWAGRADIQSDLALYRLLHDAGFRIGDGADWIEIYNRLDTLEDQALYDDDGNKIEEGLGEDRSYFLGTNVDTNNQNLRGIAPSSGF